MITAHAITSTLTGATSTSIYGFRPDDFVVGYFRLTQFVPEIPVPFITDQWFFLKFFVDRGVDFQVVPFLIQDLFEIW